MISLKSFGIIALAVIGLQSCKTASNNTLWVSGMKTECSTGAGTTNCLNIQKGEELDAQPWQNFYSNIEKFEFEEGYLKKIKISTSKINAKDVPADGSSIRYTMVKELRKIPDARVELKGSWILANMDAKPLNRMIVLPTLDFDLTKMQFSGNGGCNTYSGQITSLETKHMKLGDALTTLKACGNENIEAKYLQKLATADFYTVNAGILTMYNKFGENILSFFKTK